MNKKRFFTTILLAFSVNFAELYSPAAWYGFRKDTLNFSAGVGDSDTGKTAYYEILDKKQGEKINVLFSKSVKTSEKEWTLSFSGIKKDVTGKDALWIRETIGSDKSKIYGPYGFIKTALLENSDTLSMYSGTIKNYRIDNLKFANNDSLPLQFAYNQNGLIIAIGESSEKITISIDPSNGKTAFLKFSNRIIIYDSDDSGNKKLSFYYPERSIESKTTDIQYKVRDWEGDIKVFDGLNSKIIFIPWYDFGMKYENGRKLGIMIENGDYSYPAQAQPYSPASWGNVILK